MNITAKRLDLLTRMTLKAAMSVLQVGLPEFPRELLKDLESEIHDHLSDTLESHIAGLSKDEEAILPPTNPKDPIT